MKDLKENYVGCLSNTQTPLPVIFTFLLKYGGRPEGFQFIVLMDEGSNLAGIILIPFLTIRDKSKQI